MEVWPLSWDGMPALCTYMKSNSINVNAINNCTINGMYNMKNLMVLILYFLKNLISFKNFF